MSHLCQKTSNNYLFADSVHPTDMAHRTLYLEVENQIRLWATDFFYKLAMWISPLSKVSFIQWKFL